MSTYLTFDEFIRGLSERLFSLERPCPVESIREDHRLMEDLEFDSFDVFRVGIIVEDLAEHFIVDLDDVALPRTAGELYQAYCGLVDQRVEDLGS